MKCHTNVNSTPPTQLTHTFSYIVAILIHKIHSHCSSIMGGRGHFAFNLVVKLPVKLGYVFLSLRL
jgi:hypothetical protein